MTPALYTIGHSTKPLSEFISVLKAHNITALVDVRTVPRSRRNPQYEQKNLKESLPAAGIIYYWMQGLGGLRKARKDSPNMGWRNASFRGYADYMQTQEFANALNELETLAHKNVVAIMCAEALPWRCHRSLIADALVARGWHVSNIFDERTAKPHTLNPMARLHADGTLTYPPAQDSLQI